MNKFGKLALVMSTIAPVLGAFCVNAMSHSAYSGAAWYGGIALAMVALSALILWECNRRIEVETITVRSVHSADKESLSFLLVYLLPLLARDANQFTGDLWTAVYVFGVIALIVMHGNMVMFNPVLAIFGYHFYEVETEKGMKCTLVSSETIKKQDGAYRVHEVYPFFYMQAGKSCQTT